jgi:hypothetical protein
MFRAAILLELLPGLIFAAQNPESSVLALGAVRSNSEGLARKQSEVKFLFDSFAPECYRRSGLAG